MTYIFPSKTYDDWRTRSDTDEADEEEQKRLRREAKEDEADARRD